MSMHTEAPIGRSFTHHHNGGAPEKRETRWLTPPHIPQALGRFDLDPCGAPGHILAERTYLLEEGDDGLRDPWFGRVWLNPPYGREQTPFLERMVEHGRGTVLIFARTETRAWHKYVWPEASAVLFLSGRLTFLAGDGERASANAGAPSALIAYGTADAILLRGCGLSGQFIDLENQRAFAA